MIVLAGMKQQEVGENLHLGMRQTKHYNVFKNRQNDQITSFCFWLTGKFDYENRFNL
jgi:hypothetical protein